MTQNHYKPGDPWAICDRCGLKRRKSDLRKEWTGYFVCSDTCWEPKHPQLSIRAVSDRIAVPNARPDVSSTAGTTTLSSSAAKDATSVVVTSATGIVQMTSIGIQLDHLVSSTGEKEIQWCLVTGVSGTTMTLDSNNPLRSAATSGNTVYVPNKSDETFITDQSKSTREGNL